MAAVPSTVEIPTLEIKSGQAILSPGPMDFNVSEQ
jgi:hypothetical protein